MSLGKGIAIAGIWLAAAIMTLALAVANVEIPDPVYLLGPAGAAVFITFFLLLIDY